MAKKRFNQYQLRLIILLFLVFDHLHTILGYGPSYLQLLTAFARPLLVFFLIDTFNRGFSKKKYFKKVITFAIIVLLGNVIISISLNNISNQSGWRGIYSLLQGNNIFLTLSVFYLIMMLFDNIKKNENKTLSIILAVILSIVSCATEKGYILLPVFLIMYFFWNNQKKLTYGIILWSSLLLIASLILVFAKISAMTYDWAIIGVLLPIHFYTGRRGTHSLFSRWFFYILYPLHLWIFYIMNLIR